MNDSARDEMSNGLYGVDWAASHETVSGFRQSHSYGDWAASHETVY